MLYHNLLKKKYKNWKELESFISQLESDQDKGDITEQFVKIYLELNKELYNVDKVYMRDEMPSDIISKLKLESIDHGVDGVILRKDGKTVAYQVKFRTNRVQPSYRELATFWTESEYADYRLIFANTKTLPAPTTNRKNQISILADTLDELDSLFFTNLAEYTEQKTLTPRVKKTPRNYQKKIIDDVHNGFHYEDRGKLIAACGIGKTLISKWIMEEMDSSTTLFVAPSLSLIKQTIEEWFEKTDEPFDFIAVCSDNSVVKGIKNEDDEMTLTPTDANFPVTTDPFEIKTFISNTDKRKKVVFSTYQSIDAIANALIGINDFKFSLAIFDESHRTAGFKGSEMFTYALDDKFIPIKKRLFMTATEKIATPRIKKFAEDAGKKIFSMDDVTSYGPTLSELNFGQAIEQKIVADYKIVVCAMGEDELYKMTKNNSYVEIDVGDKIESTSMDNLMKQLILAKAINELNINKIISYHSTVKEAKSFIKGSESKLGLEDILTQASPHISDKELYLDHVNGQQKTSLRKEKLSNFEQSKYGIISNAKCLTEGIDVPAINAIYFADPKNATIDIIQAVGRALRKKADENKTAYILIPVIIPEEAHSFKGLRTDIFDTLHSVVQALRDQDDSLAEVIDEVNYQAAISGPKRGLKNKGLEAKIQILASDKIKISEFQSSLQFRIGEVNKKGEFNESKLTYTGVKGERKSSIKRVFTSIGDYKMDAYRDNLVNPTLQKFPFEGATVANSDIKINNNNISHTERIGAIEKLPKSQSKITSIGKFLYRNPSMFDEIFSQQLLRFYIVNKHENKILFPYRAILKVLYSLDYLSKFEFTWCLYPLKDTSDESIKIVIEKIQQLRQTYKNLDILNDENKEKILTMLNEKFDIELDFKDVWSSRSTAYNQFNYFKKHLLQLDNIIIEGGEKLTIYTQPGSKTNILEVLERDSYIEKKAEAISDVNDKNNLRSLKDYYNSIEELQLNI